MGQPTATPSADPRAPRGTGGPRAWRVRTSVLSLPVVTGTLTLALASIGAATTAAVPAPGSTVPTEATISYAAMSVPPQQATLFLDRGLPVSRDSQRQALGQASNAEVVPAAAAVARQRNAALAEFAEQVQQEADRTPQNSWSLPMQSYQITARFGEGSSLWVNRHTGLDFAAPTGTIVSSVTSGRVLSAAYAGAYGNRIVVSDPDGTQTWYCHLSAYAVAPGDQVTSGQTIGKVGATGNVTGPHLHLEVRPGGGDPVDPGAALAAHGVNPG